VIREALELLSRPVRRRLWDWNRKELLTQDPPSGVPPGALKIPVSWDERDPKDVKQDVHKWFAEKFAPVRESQSKAEEFLQRAKKDLKKKKFVGHFPPVGTLPEDYVPLPEAEDLWIDVGSRQERLSVIMEYYARNYRWNPLSNDEDVSFHGRGPAADRFWKAYGQSKAIAFYRNAKGAERPEAEDFDLFDHFGMNDED